MAILRIGLDLYSWFDKLTTSGLPPLRKSPPTLSLSKGERQGLKNVLKLIPVLLLIYASMLSCSGNVNDTVWRKIFVLYENSPSMGVGTVGFFDREEDSSAMVVARNPGHFADIPLGEQARTGWFSADGRFFHVVAASGRLHTFSSDLRSASETNIGLSNPVEAGLWKSRSVVAVARFNPPEVAILSSDDLARLSSFDLPGRPGRLLLDETRDRIFVSIPEKDLVLVLGLDPLRTIASLDFSTGSKPTGLAVDDSGILFVAKPGSGAVTRISPNLVSRLDLVVTGAPQAVSMGLAKEEPRLVVGNTVTHGFQTLLVDPFSTEGEITLGPENVPFELLTTPDPHFVAFLSRDPSEIGFLNLWENQITFLATLLDTPVAVFIQPPLAPDKSRF